MAPLYLVTFMNDQKWIVGQTFGGGSVALLGLITFCYDMISLSNNLSIYFCSTITGSFHGRKW